MLTSKEIIERTGISRATLNNYIGSGLVPRPQVLPPGPEHGAAPRIGYFPDDTIERIETIQRLKREGWSITRIAEYFAQGERASLGAATPAAAPAAVADTPQPPPAPAATPQPGPARAPIAPQPAQAAQPVPSGPRLTPAQASQPAYLVNDGFRLVWTNEEARLSPLSPVAQPLPPEASVFQHLLRLEEAAGRDALLRFHLEAARARGASAALLFDGLAQHESGPLDALYRGIARPAAHPLVAQSLLPAAGALPARWVHAMHFQEGVLFAVAPQAAAARTPATLPAAPALTPVAVLVAMLQDAAGLWVRLVPEEYFALLNEVALELDAIFVQHRGRARRPAAEALTCYFLPGAGGSYLWSALAAAHQAREAMRQVSQRWQVRKGWDLELRLNVGIDEGQDWLGTLGTAADADLRVLGDAADRAEHLARCSRMGAILFTRNIVGKLSREERQRLTYGAPRLDGMPGEAPLLFTFARLADVAAPGSAPPAVADLAVAELLDLNPPIPPHGGART